MNLCRPWPQGSRSGGVAEVADRVRYGEAYGRLPPPPSEFQKMPTLSVQARSREAAASQDKNFSVVAAERPQGTASTERSLFAR